MDDRQQTFLEVIAPSIEEALEKGLEDLGLPRQAVEIEVLDKGRRGLLGVGSRQVRIRLFIKGGAKAPAEAVLADIEEKGAAAQETSPSVTEFDTEAEQMVLIEIAEDTLSGLIARMGITAQITAGFEENNGDEEIETHTSTGRRILHLNITGQDLSILIGRQAETLQALQFVTSLIINKKAGRSVPISVDVEGYRSRRRRQLLQMAHRMAEQAIRTGRRQILEPMPAEDRRTIHMELRSHPAVFTESIGDEPRRKVTIVPK
jgi:spoIIIJ-associated protein